MTKRKSRRGSLAVLLAALVVLGTVAAYTAATASADGRTLQGNFCTLSVPPATPASSHFCMSITWDGATVGTATRTDPTQPDLALRPGTYWLTVTDDNNGHNFVLRSCPDSTSLCDGASGGAEQEITPLNNGAAPAPTLTETLKLNLQHGTYRLFCAAPNHENRGMYVDIAVGGVGQVG